MFGFLKKLFGGKNINFKELMTNGAQIIDVRTETEFQNGHLKNSKNIPLQNLTKEIATLDKNKPVITICASGIRSASAKGILKQKGFETYNGGSWQSLQNKIR